VTARLQAVGFVVPIAENFTEIWHLHGASSFPPSYLSEGDETHGRGHRSVKVPAGRDRRSNYPMGLAWVALKALAY
jgi:hypothetical protein